MLRVNVFMFKTLNGEKASRAHDVLIIILIMKTMKNVFELLHRLLLSVSRMFWHNLD